MQLPILQVRSQKSGMLLINGTPVAELNGNAHAQPIDAQATLYIVFLPYESDALPVARKLSFSKGEPAFLPGGEIRVEKGENGLVTVALYPEQGANEIAAPEPGQDEALQMINAFLYALSMDDSSALNYLAPALRIRTNLSALSTFFGAYSSATAAEAAPEGAGGIAMTLSYPYADERIFTFEIEQIENLPHIGDVQVYGG